MCAMDIITTHNLTKIYKNKYVALNGANLKVPKGAVFGLVGPNGAGKTTTIRLLLGLQTPTAGTARVFGDTMSPNAVHLRQRIGFLPTNPRFPKDMNPIMYLDFVGKLFGLPAEVRKPRLAALLRAVGLLGASSQKVSGFSTGMTTRLGIASSLMNDPEILIWDEPTAGLDPEGRRHTLELIQELGQNKTILVSSHNLSDIQKVCDHIGVLSDGKLIFNGPVQQMKQLTRSTSMELELEGDLDLLCNRLSEQLPHVQWERGPFSLRLYLQDEAALATQLAEVLQVIAESKLRLMGLNSLQDEMIDSFIQLLEEERSHGFSRILQVDPQNNAVPGNPGG
jgi:ABC-2 type transport system ATP-binding protein